MAQRGEWFVKFIGIIMVLLGIVGLLGFLGESNPLSMISDPLLSFTNSFLSEIASYIFWGLLILVGVTLVGPRGGYLETIVERRRR
jgi:hypothetical protein